MTMTLREAMQKAIAEFTEYGYDRPERLSEWMQRLRALVRQDQASPDLVKDRMKAALDAYFTKAVSVRVTRRNHPGVPRYTIDRIKPQLRTELTRRIMASADLIKLNREEATEKTLRRFAGWASSIPAGGSKVVAKGETKQELLKALRQLDYVERRVAIDQGHKLMSSVSDVIAQQTGAIAAMWRSHWRRLGYDYREDHKERDQKVYLIRGSWAQEKGLVKPGTAGYTDQITAPCEEVNCTCFFVYFTSLRELPDDMLTAKGREALEATRLKVA